MRCDICHRPHHTKRLPFLCAVDARNRLYEGRLEYARALIQAEEAESRVNDALEKAAAARDPKSKLKKDEKDVAAARIAWLTAEEQAALERTSHIIAQADKLRSEIEAARKEIAVKKDAIARRRSDLMAVTAGTVSRRARQLDEVERSTQRLRYKWNRIADATAITRAFLCEEAARLYGLRQIEEGSAKRYEIGGVELFDLHTMNGLSPELISTSLAHVAHILVLACDYLAIRLPAEITLPHKDYPRPTIFSLSSSYKHDKVIFPGSALAIQQSAAAAAEDKRLPRPRPLWTDRPLPTLAKDYPDVYSYFLEGVALLAYDIAWVCCSQGVSLGDGDPFEEVCAIGKNLWRLLIAGKHHNAHQPHKNRRRSPEPAPYSPLSGNSPRTEDIAGEMANPKSSTSTLGRWSHGTCHSYLGTAEGMEFIRSFKLLSPYKIYDKLKRRLSADAPLMDWERIEGDELDDGFEDGMLGRIEAGGNSAGMNAGNGPPDIRLDRGNGGGGSSHGGIGIPKGTSGWTKLRNR